MYCEQCGTKIPDGGVFCPQCGKATSGAEPTPSIMGCNGAKSQSSSIGDAVQDKKKGDFSKKKAVLIGMAVLLVAAALFACMNWRTLLDPNALRKDVPRHVPTIEEIGQLSDTMDGGGLSFERMEVEVYKEGYRCLLDGEDCGDLFLWGKSEDVGIYIDKSAPDSYAVFGKLSVSAAMACDSSLSFEEAKKVVNTALEDEETVNNGVTFRTNCKSDRYIFRMDIPEGRKSGN